MNFYSLAENDILESVI